MDPFQYGEDTSAESRARQLRDLGLSPEEDGGELSSAQLGALRLAKRRGESVQAETAPQS